MVPLCGYESPNSLLHLFHHKPIFNLKEVLLAELFVGILYSDIYVQILGELKHARLVREHFVGLLEIFLILDCEVGGYVFVQVSQKIKSHLSSDA
jgi:hypothetical protein